jgi:hypothetical protein
LAANVGAQGALVQCPLRKKPNPDQFVRASSDPALADFPCALLELQTSREEYLLVPELADQLAPLLPNLVKDQCLTPAIDRQGAMFLWRYTPAHAPTGDNAWHVSMRLAIAAAQQEWVRIESKQGYYGFDRVKIDIPDPVWPQASLRDLLKLAFGDRIIEDISHPIIQRLLGQTA